MKQGNDMMQHMFRVQIAMLAHGVVAGYRKAMGLEPMPPFSDLGAAEQDELLENVDFWLANPSAPIAASHEAWLVRGIAEGWRLGETLDMQAKLSPFIRPFDTLPKDMVVMEHLFRAAVDSVTRAGNELPEYRRRIERINAAIARNYGHIEDVKERGRLWNLLPEEERMAILDKMRAEEDALRARMERRSRIITATLAHKKFTPAEWEALDDKVRLAHLDEYGAISGDGNFLNEEETAQRTKELAEQAAAQAAWIAERAERNKLVLEAAPDAVELTPEVVVAAPAPDTEGMEPAPVEPAGEVK